MRGGVRPWHPVSRSCTLERVIAMALERLSADDRLVLWPDELWPQDVGALGILAGGPLLHSEQRFDLEAARDTIAARLHLVPRLRQIIHEPRRGLGGPLWVDARDFDITLHVRTAQVEAPGDEVQLLQAVEQLRRRPLDRARPLWEMWFLTGLPNGRLGLFIRLHHVVADGIAGVASLGVFLDRIPDAAPLRPPPWTPAPSPAARRLLADTLHRRADHLGRGLSTLTRPSVALRRGRATWPALRELLAGEPGPKTSLNRVIGADRNLALVRSTLDEVKQVAHRHDATVNDVLLTAVAGGVRTLLVSRGESAADLLVPIYVPVTLRSGGLGDARGNLIGQMVVPLPIGMADPRERLARIASETAHRKALPRPSLGSVFRSKLLSGLLLKRITRQRINLTSADLPGPPQPLSFAGAQLLELFPLLNLIGNVTLGVAALSYAGQFNALVVADAHGYPDLDVFVTAMQEELTVLAHAAVPTVTRGA
jgi:diacylglycerol O-acyltransferase / wax synthase